MSARTRANCPREHSRLFKVGTVKKGKHDNYVVVESAKGVKRWKRQTQLSDIYSELSLHDWYGIPEVKPSDYDKYTENLTDDQKKSMDKLRNSYYILEDLNVYVVECLNPISKYGFYWGDYPWDYASLVRPDIDRSSTPCVIINIHIDANFHLDVEDGVVYAQHINLNNHIDAIGKFIHIYNSTPNGTVSWSNLEGDAICFRF